jgi:hypothetical protein
MNDKVERKYFKDSVQTKTVVKVTTGLFMFPTIYSIVNVLSKAGTGSYNKSLAVTFTKLAVSAMVTDSTVNYVSDQAETYFEWLNKAVK